MCLALQSSEFEIPALDIGEELECVEQFVIKKLNTSDECYIVLLSNSGFHCLWVVIRIHV